MNEDLEKVEIKVAYLEAQNAELNEVLIEQQKSIDSLTLQLRSLARKVEDLIEEAGSGSRENRRPPHY